MSGHRGSKASMVLSSKLTPSSPVPASSAGQGVFLSMHAIWLLHLQAPARNHLIQKKKKGKNISIYLPQLCHMAHLSFKGV